MKKLQLCLIVVLAVALAGSAIAGDYGKKSLVGTWEFDMVKLMKTQMGGEVPEGMDIEQMLAGAFMRITFKSDGTFTFDAKTPMGADTQNGTWKLMKTEENKLTIKSTSTEGEEQTVVVLFSDMDNFEALMPGPNDEDVSMSAKRVTEEKAKEEKPMEKKEG